MRDADGIRFILNDRDIEVRDGAPDATLLDFLRLQLRLTGTKEGCAEGDCGACTVLVGRLMDGRLVYEPVNACIRFLASCHATHVVTIEHLRGAQGGLHPVQLAMMEHHGSQCGFCTPGIVMALYGLWIGNPKPDAVAVETALQGNLCRCTGYESIVRAALAAAAAGGQAFDRLAVEREDIMARLAKLAGSAARVEGPSGLGVVPADLDQFAQIYADMPEATLVAGATDVGLWVTKFLKPISPAIFIGGLDGLKGVTQDGEWLSIGAGATYSEAEDTIRRLVPGAADYWSRIGGWQVRNAGTIGGNIANGSPIGETPPLMIALGAEITLRHRGQRRRMKLEDFFIAYGKQDRQKGEFLETIHVPLPAGRLVSAYKVSKRHHADISAVAAGFCITVRDGIIEEARIAFGGMAGTPKRATGAEVTLTGAPFCERSFEAAAAAIPEDFTPLSDWRASADYRLLVAANLLRRFWLEHGTGDVHRLDRGVDATIMGRVA